MTEPLPRAMALLTRLMILGWILGASAGGAGAAVFSVTDFGAIGDGKADDGPAIRQAIYAAMASKEPATILFDKKTYRVGERRDRWEAFDLIGARDVVIDGNGASLVISPNSRAFLLEDCIRCTVQNFTIDYAPLPFTQGDIVDIDLAAQTFDLKLHNGYPDPPAQEWMEKNYGLRGGWRFGPLFSGSTRRFTSMMGKFGGYFSPKSVHLVDSGQRVYRLSFFDAKHLGRVHKGDQFVLRVRYAERKRIKTLKGLSIASIQIRRSSECALRNIQQYSSPNMSVHLWANKGRITLDRFQVMTKPGTNRLVASLSDGIHCKASRIGPIIENCYFERMMDDSINIGTMADVVEEVISDTVLRTRCTSIAWYVNPIEPGDQFEAVDMKAGRILGHAKVIAVKNISGHTRTIVFDRAIPGIYARKNAKDMACCWLINLSACGNGYIIRNNYFGPQMRSAMLLRASGLIENNVIDDMGGLGVFLTNDLAFPAGPIPRDTIIRNNEIRNCRHHPGISIGSASFNPDMTPLAENILVENNRISMLVGFPAIRLNNVRSATLRNNHLSVFNSVEPIEIRNSDDIIQENNTIERGDKSLH